MSGGGGVKIDIHKEVEIESTIRTELLSSMFEVPAKTKLSVSLTGDLPLIGNGWNIGLIVGPSGSGKTLLLEELFGKPRTFHWKAKSVIDDFDKNLTMEEITRVCQCVGFNTVPSWMRPYSVLSNGERFRAEVARYLVEDVHGCTADSNINVLSPVRRIDEFTSVVDRQVAQFACHAIQKYVREHKKVLCVASCHYDIIPWLQPDWILEPGNPCRFTWRSLQRRPPITVSVQRSKYETWELFKDFHYMTQELNKAARCYGLYVSSESAAVEKGYSNEQLHSYNDGCLHNGGDGPGLRIPSSGSTDRIGDPDLVLQPSGESTSDRSARCDEQQNSHSDESTVSTNDAAASQATCSISTATKSIHSEHIWGMGSSRGTYRIASFCGVLYRPHPRVSDIYGFTRMVTLPDFQGLGLAFVLACTVASAYKALGKRLHSYPNHPAWIRSYQRSNLWMQLKNSGEFSPRRGISSTVGGFGGRRCAVFQYVGDAMNKEDAERLINVD